MANTFFDFDTSLNNGDNSLPPDDEDCLENEEEYDALNDETFGALEDASSLDDWEQQHEQYAEIAESSKHSDKLENSISQLVLDDSEKHTPPTLSDSVWSYTPTSKNGDIFNTAILSSLQKASKSFIQTRTDSPSTKSAFTPADLNSSSPLATLPAQPRKICTVEELEKNLLQSSKQQLQQTQQQHANQQKSSTLPSPLGQHSAPPRPILPPGHHPHPQGFPFHPLLQQHVHQVPPPPHLAGRPAPPPGMRGVMPPMLPPHAHHPRAGGGLPLPPQPAGMPHPGLLPPGLLRVMHPRFMAAQAAQQGAPPRPPGFGYPPPPQQQHPPPPPGHQGHHPYNFPPPPHGAVLPVPPQNRMHPHHQHQGQGQHPHQQQGQRTRRDSREDKQRRHDYEEHQQQGGD